MIHPLDSYRDIHCHDRSRELAGDTVVNLEPGDEMLPGGTYSVGIHPWRTDRPVTCGQLRRLVMMARDVRTVAIGEAGIDRLRGGSVECQRRLFVLHARLAAGLSKPLIIHCVRAYDIVLAEARRLRPRPGMWIMHGFRRNVELARQLLAAGIDISVKEADLPRYASLPRDRVHVETDAQGA